MNLVGVQNGSPECCLDLLIMLFYVQKLTEPGVDVRQFDFHDSERSTPLPQLLCGFLTSPKLCQQLSQLGILSSTSANVLKAHQEQLRTEQEAAVTDQGTDGLVVNQATRNEEQQLQLCLKESEQKLRVQSRQVEFLGLEKELEKQRCEQRMHQLREEHQAQMQLAARNSVSDLEVARLMATKAQVKLSEEFDARLSILEDEARGHTEDVVTEIEDVQEIASLRRRCTCQAVRIDNLEQSNRSLLAQLEQMHIHVQQEQESSRTICSKLFGRQLHNVEPQYQWMEDLTGVQMAGAVAMKQQIEQLRLAEQAANAKHQASVHANEVLKLGVQRSPDTASQAAPVATPGSDKRIILAHSSNSPSNSPRRFELAELVSA